MNIEMANRLADLRKQHGYSQEELAAKLGVSRQAVSKWECGESSPDTDNIIALAQLYGMSIDDLLGNPVKKEEEKQPDPEPEAVDAEVVDEHEWKHIHPDDDHDDDDDDDDDDDQYPKGKGVHIRVSYALTNGAGFFIAAIAYLLMGFFWLGPTGCLGWSVGWISFLIAILVADVIKCIRKRSFHSFSYPVLVVAVYCGMGIIGGAYGINLWHPYWFLFITIPIYYIVADAIDKK